MGLKMGIIVKYSQQHRNGTQIVETFEIMKSAIEVSNWVTNGSFISHCEGATIQYQSISVLSKLVECTAGAILPK